MSKPPGLLLSSAQEDARIFRELCLDTEQLFEWSKPYGHALREPHWNSHGDLWFVEAFAWDTSVWPKPNECRARGEGKTILLAFQDLARKLRALEEPWARLADRSTPATTEQKAATKDRR